MLTAQTTPTTSFSHGLFGHKQDPKVAALRSIGILSEVPNRVLEGLAGHFDALELPAGRELVHEDGASREFMLLIDGEAEVFRGGLSLAILGPGDVIGEMGVIGHTRRSAAVVARTDVRVLVAPYTVMRRLIEADESVAAALDAMIASRSVA